MNVEKEVKSVCIASVGNDIALILNGKFVASVDSDESNEEAALLERMAEGISEVFGVMLERRNFEIRSKDWDWSDILNIMDMQVDLG